MHLDLILIWLCSISNNCFYSGFHDEREIFKYLFTINFYIKQWNQQNHKHQKYFWNVAVEEKSQSGMRKLNCKLQTRKPQTFKLTLLLKVSGFLACWDVLIFAVIGYNTTNTLKTFQVFCFDSLTVVSKYVQSSIHQKCIFYLIHLSRCLVDHVGFVMRRTVLVHLAFWGLYME